MKITQGQVVRPYSCAPTFRLRLRSLAAGLEAEAHDCDVVFGRESLYLTTMEAP